ncbi:MAG: PrpF domain-containing protein, partial [Actinomycetota bacterium]
MLGSVPTTLMRGGSSKGLFLLASDLPADRGARDRLLRALMGSPDARQIDGLGGAHPLTSKVAVIDVHPTDRADVHYLFLQVGVDTDVVTDRQNCGNLLAGVGPFALDRGLLTVAPNDDEATVRILMLNTDSVATARFPVSNGRPQYAGDTAISGVPGTAAPIKLEFEDLAGGSCGSLLPTGRVSDTVAGTECTLIDNGMPVVVMRGPDLGITGTETCAELEADRPLRERLEEIRLTAGPLMNLGDVT